MDIETQIQEMVGKISEIEKELQDGYTRFLKELEEYEVAFQQCYSANRNTFEVSSNPYQEGYGFFDQYRREWVFVEKPKQDEIENQYLRQALAQYKESLAQLNQRLSDQKTIVDLEKRVSELESENQALREKIAQQNILLRN